VAELEPAGAWPVARITAAFAALDSARTLNCDGYNAAAQAWEALVDGADYARFRIGLQLTDRGGPIKESDLAAFQQGIEALAADGAAQVRWAGAHSPLTNAAELDAFCAEVDVQIGINLVASASFAETKFRGLAEANGFQREDDGMFRRRDDDGRVLLVLRQSAPAVVSITLDVPRVPRDAAAFGLMAHCARTLAKGLDAKIVDDNQKILDDATLARIGQGIAGIQGRMEAAGLASGGALALRLFA
jgi:ZipA, C-terminal FtsZ-binding domain